MLENGDMYIDFNKTTMYSSAGRFMSSNCTDTINDFDKFWVEKTQSVIRPESEEKNPVHNAKC